MKKCYPDINDNLLAYKFATYSVATNRLYLRKLMEEEKIKDFPSDFNQFIVIDYNSEANMKFERLKKDVRLFISVSIKQHSCFMAVLQRIGIASFAMVFEFLATPST
jgi:saccharopine dehydrogenase-like NADP-dependent oxidoreductase